MNKLLKILILVLVSEILIGYFIYLNNTSKITGHYISAIISSIENIINKSKVNSNENIKVKINCEIEKNINQDFEVSGITALRNSIKFQTNINFLENIDIENDYLILIMGNSETYGEHYREDEKKLHVLLQEKLRNKIQSQNIYIVNLAWPATFINDHLPTLLNFTNLYKPDLVLFYTGGNELNLLDSTYKDLLKKSNLNLKNQYWYSLFNTSKKLDECVDEKIFLTKNNFYNKRFKLDLAKYVKKNFNKINLILTDEEIDFIFYIQPFNQLIKPSTQEISNNLKILSNINIINKNFKNLNLLSKKLNLDFIDLFHTYNANTISDVLLEDILNNYKEKIYDKIE